MPTPKELKGELEGKFIDVVLSPWHKKRYKVLGYDSETDLYSCAPTKVEGPLEHIKLKAENITVYVDVIPVEESSEDETSESEDEDDDEEEEEEKEASPFTADELQKMNQNELVKWCRKYNLFTKEWLRTRRLATKMRPALAQKFGLESTFYNKQQKVEEARDAMAKFLLLPVVVAITSKIPDFDHKNKAHADTFMEQYREQNGNGTIRSRKINLNVMRSPRRVDAVLGASMCVVRRGHRAGLRRGLRDAVDAFARIL